MRCLGGVIEYDFAVTFGQWGQARGEIRPGDPRLFAMGLMGPMVLSMVWRETFEPIGAQPLDVVALAEQHLDTVLRGMRP